MLTISLIVSAQVTNQLLMKCTDARKYCTEPATCCYKVTDELEQHNDAST